MKNTLKSLGWAVAVSCTLAVSIQEATAQTSADIQNNIDFIHKQNSGSRSINVTISPEEKATGVQYHTQVDGAPIMYYRYEKEPKNRAYKMDRVASLVLFQTRQIIRMLPNEEKHIFPIVWEENWHRPILDQKYIDAINRHIAGIFQERINNWDAQLCQDLTKQVEHPHNVQRRENNDNQMSKYILATHKHVTTLIGQCQQKGLLPK